MARMSNQELQLRLQHKGVEHLLSTSVVFRRFIWTVLTEAGIFEGPYRQGRQFDTAVQVGRQALGLEILNLLKPAWMGKSVSLLGLLEQEGDLLSEEVAEAESQELQPGDHPDDDDDEQTPPGTT